MFKTYPKWFVFHSALVLLLLQVHGLVAFQFSSVQIFLLSTSYICRSERLGWLSLHALSRADSWPFPFLAWSGFEPFFLSICQIWFYGLCKFWCAFGIETCFIFRSSLSGFVEHLFLNTRLTSEMLGTCLNSDLYSFLFLFSIVGYCNYFTARVSMPCALIVWLWLKDKAGVFSDSTYPCH